MCQGINKNKTKQNKIKNTKQNKIKRTGEVNSAMIANDSQPLLRLSQCRDYVETWPYQS